MRRTNQTPPPGARLVGSLVVSVKDTSEAVPQHGTDESYVLSVPDDASDATLVAPTVYGALRGLETFSQLLRYNTTTMR